MSIPQPQFEEGDTVFHATTRRETEKYDCPDCEGSREWAVQTPGGSEFTVECQRCGSYTRGDLPSLKHTVYYPEVKKRTIGSVRIDSSDEDPVTYMCEETGVGTGRIYKESDLYAGREAAQEAAEVEAEQKNEEAGEKPQRIHTDRMSDLRLHEALRVEKRAVVQSSHYALRHLQWDLHDALEMAESTDEYERQIERALEKARGDKWADPHPLAELLEAVRQTIRMLNSNVVRVQAENLPADVGTADALRSLEDAYEPFGELVEAEPDG